MLEFKVIELSDKSWIKELLRKSDFRGCEYSFANNMAWRRLYETKISRYKDFYISCSHKYGVQFTFPAGEGDYKDVIEQMKEYAGLNNSPLIIGSVTNKNLKLFEELYSGQYTALADENCFDYIYEAESLINLAGKKYHKKRNHIKKLYENNWEYSELTEKDYNDCIEFAVRSYNDNKAYDDESSVSEQFAINTFFTQFKELDLKGGVIRVNGKLEGFTIGEAINSDTYGIHIEKANASVQGAYAAINREFAESAASGYKYINREEDLGIEGLRKSKRSYYPAFLLEKNTITFR